MLDPAQLQFDIDPNSSVMVYDKDSNDLVMVILRDFTGHPGLLAYLEDIIKSNLEHRKNMRVSVILNPFIYHIHFTGPSLPILARLFS